ncbi:MAG: zinc-binding dehydrogenase [Deltaproteobacteria bacterium]|nr:zinc-binding dehydrogenase [Deltaproteobacteria bacterium]
MKAAVIHRTGPPEVLRYEELPDPPCAPDGVVVEVEAISIEGGDLGNRARGAIASFPHVVGYQCAGRVREVGPEVRDRRAGQRVVAMMLHGSHAERVAVPAGFTWPVPDGADLEAAACVPIPFGTADDCLFEFGRLAAGETVLIQAGASGVGLAAIQLAKRAGARVIATAGSEAKLARLRSELGLDHGIDYRARDFVAAVQEITGGRGCDLVVDPVGGATLQKSLACLGYRGRCITVGDASRAGRQLDVASLSAGNRSLTGVFLGAEAFFARERVFAMIARHLDDVAAGRLRVFVDRRFPLAEAAAAHAYGESRAAFGRVVLVP